MLKKIVISTLYIISFTSIILASGIKQVANWWDIARPYFAIWFISTLLAVCITYFNQIRRVLYPAIVCISAWLYKHKVLMTDFTRNTHRVYNMKDKSYQKLFAYTQDLFDIYLDALNR